MDDYFITYEIIHFWMIYIDKYYCHPLFYYYYYYYYYCFTECTKRIENRKLVGLVVISSDEAKIRCRLKDNQIKLAAWIQTN